MLLSLAACEAPKLSHDPNQSPLLASGTLPNSRPWTSTQRRSGQVTETRNGNELFNGVEDVGSGTFTAERRPTVVIPEKTASGADGLTLNLLNVPIAQAAKFVLGDVLKANYTIGDKVAGNITIQTTAPVPKDALVDIFENALRLNGAALVRGEGHFKIIPAANAAQAVGRISPSGRGGGPGMQVQVIPLRHVSAAEMKRILDPVTPQGAILRVDAARNLLVLGGSGRELSDAASLVTLFDVDWMRGMSVALYVVKSSDPEPIAKELESILGLDRDSPLKGLVRVIPNRRLSAIMVISSKPGPLETARSWIERLDKVAEGSEEQLFVYKIKNRGASELAGILSRVLTSRDPNGAMASATSPNAVAPRFEPTSVSTTGAADGRGEQRATSGTSSQRVLTGGQYESALSPRNIEPLATPQDFPYPPQPGPTTPSNQAGQVQRVVADEPNNALLITATRKEYQRILQILARLDTLPTQVMLEAMIAEVTLTDELKFGLKWFLEKGKHSFTLSDAVSGAVAPQFPGFSYFFSAANMNVALDAISGITKVNVVSSPSLMVLDNRKATLQIGDQVPIVTQTSQSTAVVGAPVINAVTMKDTGIILNVTPRVSDSGRVVLDIEQEVSNVAKTTSSGIDSPTIQQRRIRTTVVVADNEVVALGGLIQERDNISKTQVPILGDIPVVGAMFRQKTDRIDRTELLIFIKPMVVRDANESRQVTEEFRNRINLEPLTSTKGRNKFDRDAQRILR
jgi:general secretion pathway protein D